MHSTLASEPLPHSPPPPITNSTEKDSHASQGTAEHVTTVEDAADASLTDKSNLPRLTPSTELDERPAKDESVSCCSTKTKKTVSDIDHDAPFLSPKWVPPSMLYSNLVPDQNMLQWIYQLVRDFINHVEIEQKEFRLRGNTSFALDITSSPHSGVNSPLGRRGTFQKDAPEHQSVEENAASLEPRISRNSSSSSLLVNSSECSVHIRRGVGEYMHDAHEILAREAWLIAHQFRLQILSELEVCRVHGPEDIAAYSKLIILACRYLRYCSDKLVDGDVKNLLSSCIHRYLAEQHPDPKISSLLCHDGPYLELEFPHHLRSPLMSPHIYPGSSNAAKRSIEDRMPHLPAEVKRKVTEVEELIGDDNEIYDFYTAWLLEDLELDEEDEQIKELLQGEIAVQRWKERRSRRSRMEARKKKEAEQPRRRQGLSVDPFLDFYGCCL